MNTSKGMETDLFVLLRRCIEEKDADASARLAEEQAALNDRKCTAPELGRWIDASDFPFLIETLMLSDAVFSEEYPQVKLTAEERRSFAYALEDHCENCPHCGLKRAADLDWQRRVNNALSENREAIGQIIARTTVKK